MRSSTFSTFLHSTFFYRSPYFLHVRNRIPMFSEFFRLLFGKICKNNYQNIKPFVNAYCYTDERALFLIVFRSPLPNLDSPDIVLQLRRCFNSLRSLKIFIISLKTSTHQKLLLHEAFRLGPFIRIRWQVFYVETV